MAACLEKIERYEQDWIAESDTPWKQSRSRKWRKREMNRYLRRQYKRIDSDDIGGKRGRKPYKGWEY